MAPRLSQPLLKPLRMPHFTSRFEKDVSWIPGMFRLVPASLALAIIGYSLFVAYA